MPSKTNSTASNSGRLVLWCALALGLSASLGLVVAALGCWSFSYDAFATFVLHQVNKPDWRTYFETTVFTPQQYQLLPWLLLVSSGLAGLFTFLLWRYRDAFAKGLSSIFYRYKTAWRRGWQHYSPRERWVLLGLCLAFLARSIYYAHRYELQYDEGWTYNHFISNGILTSLLSPNNNHILYTVLACIADWLPLEAKYTLRLPVILGGLSLLLSAAWWWRRSWSWGWTLLALSWLAFCPGVSLYSLYARGYIFQLFFTCWGLGLTLHLMHTARASSSTAAWLAWSCCIIGGLWSVPTHAYVAVVLSGVLFFWCIKNHGLKPWLLANIGAVSGALLLYAPYFLTNGWATLWAAAATEAPRGDAFVAYQDKVTDWLLLGAGRGTPVYGVLLLLVSSLGWGAWRQWRRGRPAWTPLVLVALLLLPTGLNALTGVQPPYRVWCFLSVPLAWGLGWLGEHYGGAWRGRAGWLGGLVLVGIGFQLWRLERHYALQWSAELDRQVKTMAYQLIEEDAKHVYLFTHYDKPLLECYYLRAQRSLQLYLADSRSLHHTPFKTPSNYDAVIWNPSMPIPDSFAQQQIHQFYPRLLYQDTRIHVHSPAKSTQ